MSIVYFSIGSNLGNRLVHLNDARKQLKSKIGKILKESQIYETEPWGFKYERDFLNMVIEVKTSLSYNELINKIIEIENGLGRVRNKHRYISRVIDIDILFYNNLIVNEKKIIIPHPLLQDRKFVLIPFNEINGSFVHPLLNKSISELLSVCDDNCEVRKYTY